MILTSRFLVTDPASRTPCRMVHSVTTQASPGPISLMIRNTAPTVRMMHRLNMYQSILILRVPYQISSTSTNESIVQGIPSTSHQIPRLFCPSLHSLRTKIRKCIQGQLILSERVQCSYGEVRVLAQTSTTNLTSWRKSIGHRTSS